MSLSVNEAIEWLAEQRRHPDRQSAKIVEYGQRVIEGGNFAKKLGDEQWSFLEQVGVAALDVGNIDLAELCVSRLQTRFPKSERVGDLISMLQEATGQPQLARDLSEKRRIAQESGTAGLVKYLDTYYSDAEAWQELASRYLEQHLYAQAKYALEEVILLEPQNTYRVLQYAECLSTMGNAKASYIQYLRALEMCGGISGGPFARTLWGLKAIISTIRKENIDVKDVGSAHEIDVLVTDLLLNKVYSGSSMLPSVRKVMQ